MVNYYLQRMQQDFPLVTFHFYFPLDLMQQFLSSTKLPTKYNYTLFIMAYQGQIPDFLNGRGGSILGPKSKKRGVQEGVQLGPNVKKPISWHKKGGQTPWTPPPPPCLQKFGISRTEPFEIIHSANRLPTAFFINVL